MGLKPVEWIGLFGYPLAKADRNKALKKVYLIQKWMLSKKFGQPHFYFFSFVEQVLNPKGK